MREAMRYYIKKDEAVFIGPYTTDQIREVVDAGQISEEALTVEATGQTHRQLMQNTNWITVKDLLLSAESIGVGGQASSSGGSAPPPARSSVEGKIVRRYQDAYRVSASIIGYGNSLKKVGIILGFLVTFAGLAIFKEVTLAAVGSLLLGLAIGLPLYQLGVLIAAQGEMLRATLDTAVNTSPLLDNDDRRIAMGL